MVTPKFFHFLGGFIAIIFTALVLLAATAQFVPTTPEGAIEARVVEE